MVWDIGTELLMPETDARLQVKINVELAIYYLVQAVKPDRGPWCEIFEVLLIQDGMQQYPLDI
jgi:hypothetical protein